MGEAVDLLSCGLDTGLDTDNALALSGNRNVMSLHFIAWSAYSETAQRSGSNRMLFFCGQTVHASYLSMHAVYLPRSAFRGHFRVKWRPYARADSFSHSPFYPVVISTSSLFRNHVCVGLYSAGTEWKPE